MNRSGTSRFWVVAAILVGATISLASGQPAANWSYTYSDDFQSSKIEQDSYFHSIIWPQGAFPPSEPYLYYKDTGELGFGGFNGQDYAQLSYRFPFQQAQYVRTVSGELKVDVFYPYENSGSKQELLYSLSSDGIVWTPAKKLASGTNTIPLESIRGISYITFSGIGVLIDNIEVVLHSYAADHFVPAQFPTIQDAIDNAENGDVIEVAEGTYTGNGNWDIDFKGKAITVYSKMGPEKTIIDCAGSHRGFYFHNAEEPNSVLRGFTILNGSKPGTTIPTDTSAWNKNASYPIGAGIYCEFSNPSIVNCIIRDCKTELGGGIGIVGAAPMIADCTIEDCNAGGFGHVPSGGKGAGVALIGDSNAVIINSVITRNYAYIDSQGAGVYCYQSKAILARCTISHNNARGDVIGGGIYAAGLFTNLELQNCVIVDNNAEMGAGIYTDSTVGIAGLEPNVLCNVLVTNCTIANNKVTAPQVTIGGGIHSVSSNIVIRNSIIWGNNSKNIFMADSYYLYPVRYSDIQGGYDGQNNINVDPNFASPAAGDYHLKSEYGRYDPVTKLWVLDNYPDVVHSPCIDAGDPQDTPGPEPYPNGKRINMGAYGGTDQASMNHSSRVLHVDKNGNGSSGLSRSNAYRKIQDAIDASNDGDYVMIWPGTYSEEVSFRGRAITVQSADDAAVVIANQGGYAFSFNTGESRDSVLRNLIIKNCTGEGAIYCEFLASPTLTNLTIVNNSAGIRTFYGASPSVKNCIFKNNTYGDYDKTDPYILRNISYCRLDAIDKLLDQKTNFTDDPKFVDNNNDFHLQSYYGRYSPTQGWVTTDSFKSPCIDTGETGIDFSREPRPRGNAINMGAYGGTPFASKSSTVLGENLY